MNRWFGKAERNILGVQLANERRRGENAKSFVFSHQACLYFFRSAVFDLEEASDTRARR